MEIIEDKTVLAPTVRRNVATKIYLGILLVLAGLLWMTYNLGDGAISYRLFHAIFSWQTLVIVAGGFLLTLRYWVAGAMVSAVGLLFVLAEHLHFRVPIGEILLPCVLIALGVILLVPQKK